MLSINNRKREKENRAKQTVIRNGIVEEPILCLILVISHHMFYYIPQQHLLADGLFNFLCQLV